MRILYLDLDTLRPDHLGCYGYGRNTSPNIDSIAHKGVVFTNYYCSDAPCLPSRSATMSGRFGIHTGVVGHGGTAANFRLEGKKRGFRDNLSNHTLPAFIKRQGIKTVSISPFAERHSSWNFHVGFVETHDTGSGGGESAEQITPTVLKWLNANAAEDNWMLHINYWDAHTEYRAPADFGNPFENEPLPDNWIDEKVFTEHTRKIGPHSPNEISMYDDHTNPRHPRHLGRLDSLDDVKYFIDQYDTGIKYMDMNIGIIFDELKRLNVYDDLAVIISTDHAENMGELGIYGEHATADHANCHIPFIIKWPGGKAGTVDNGLHYNIDLLPTLSDLFKKPKMPVWDGVSYAPAVLEGKSCGREYLVMGQCAHVCQRGVRFGDWHYIRTYHDGFHLFPKEMLFNLKNDIHEQNNLAESKKDICMQAVYYLNDWHDEMMATMDYDSDPLWTVIHEGGPFHARNEQLLPYLNRLKETGREWGVDELIRRHPQAFEKNKN